MTLGSYSKACTVCQLAFLACALGRSLYLRRPSLETFLQYVRLAHAENLGSLLVICRLLMLELSETAHEEPGTAAAESLTECPKICLQACLLSVVSKMIAGTSTQQVK